MSNIYKGEFQDYEGNVVYPHTTADVVFATDGKTVQAKLNEIGEGLVGVTGRTDSPEVDDSNILATSKAVHAVKSNLIASNGQDFKFAVQDGKYGYIAESEGADTFFPFKDGVEYVEFKINSTTATRNGTDTENIDKQSASLVIRINKDGTVTGSTSKTYNTGGNYTSVSRAQTDFSVSNIKIGT